MRAILLAIFAVVCWATSGGAEFAPGPCDASEIKAVANAHPVRAANCPVRTSWMQPFLDASRSREEMTFISVGCNKGTDFISTLGAMSGNQSYNEAAWTAWFKGTFNSTLLNPVCGPDKEAPLKSGLESPRPIRGFCVEPMNANLKLLKGMHSQFHYSADQVKIISAAASAQPGKKRFPQNKAIGTEWVGLSHATSSDPFVDVITVDGIIADNHLDIVDYVSIDAEGYDQLVIMGMMITLVRHKVRMFEFEYHNVGHWALHGDLEMVAMLLSKLGYECYIQQNSGALYRLTQCWAGVHLADRTWSNMVCISREEEEVAKAMYNVWRATVDRA